MRSQPAYPHRPALTSHSADDTSISQPEQGGRLECRPGVTLPADSQHYDTRSAVERVNSRLAGPFGFDDPFIRGLAKMRLRCTMALSIMLAMALGRIEAGQREHLRSLTKSA